MIFYGKTNAEQVLNEFWYCKQVKFRKDTSLIKFCAPNTQNCSPKCVVQIIQDGNILFVYQFY